MKNTRKIGFWTTWLHGRHQVNGSGSLVPLIQCNKNSWTANVQSPSSRSKFPSFKSYLASLELSPVKSYQIFYFVNFRLDGRPCLLQTDIKRPLLGPFVFRQWVLPWSGKCGPRRYDAGRGSRECKCSELCYNTDGSGVWACIVTTDGKYLINHLIIIQQIQDHICLIKDFSLSNTKK